MVNLSGNGSIGNITTDILWFKLMKALNGFGGSLNHRIQLETIIQVRNYFEGMKNR